MGTVYAAVQTETGAPAAVKVLSAALAQEEGFRARFESEIETLRKLRHPNIVRLFGFGEHEGHLFYAMELVEGTSLEDELRAGRNFDWREVTQITISMARALKHAHDRGVIHRDIKPANIMLSRDGELKLSDFGIAKLFGSTGLTADGGVVGTAEYMAPEQADGRPVTYRADLYSLGGVMFALLTGRPPFRARSLVEMLQLQRFAEPEPVRTYAPSVPEELEAIVQELLAKDPSERIPNAMILVRRLEAMAHGLLRREHETLTGQDAAAADFELSAPPAVRSSPPNDPNDVETLAATMASSPESPPAEEAPAGGKFELAETGAGRPTSAGEGSPVVDFSLAPAVKAGSQTSVESATAATHSGSSRFVTVAEEADQSALEEDTEPALISPQTWVLVAALVIVGLGAWYLLQPVSADRLYERIAAQADDGEIESLLAVESDIHDFLNHHPGDRRSGELREHLEVIELHRAQRRFERRARGLGGGETTSPVEQMYLEAVRYVQLDPARGAAKLQALIDVFQDEAASNAETKQCLELARHQLDQMQADLAGKAELQQEVASQRLAHANELLESDPAAAAAIYRGIIELYGEKPWSSELIAAARAQLAIALSTPEAMSAAAEQSDEKP